MNDLSESTRYGHASVEDMNGGTVDLELSDHSLGTLPDEIFQRSTRERAHRFQIWQLLSSGQELGMESGRINKFMAVFSPVAPVWLWADPARLEQGVREPALERSEVHR